MPDEAGPFARTIEGRITWARNACEMWAPSLDADPETALLFARFGDAHRASRLEADSSGTTALCGLCDREGGGSCCGAGIELKYDGWLLLVNLVFGIRLPERPARPGGCFFLGDNGCTLAARHVLCINYLCCSVVEKTEPAAMRMLRDREGAEIDAVFRLNERIKRVIWDGERSAVT